jgi:hypothetical protein
LCKTPNKTVVQFALKGIEMPIGVADYELSKALPKQLKGEMPTIKELEIEIEKEAEKLQRPVDKKLSRLNELLKDLKEEPVKEKYAPENTAAVFNKVVLPLKTALHAALENQISKLFDQTEMMLFIDNQGYVTDKVAKEHLLQQKNCREFKIDIHLRGFKRAGVKAFNCWQQVSIKLDEYKYTIDKSMQPNDMIYTKLYHQMIDKVEINNIVEAFMEDLIGNITQQIERINKELTMAKAKEYKPKSRSGSVKS